MVKYRKCVADYFSVTTRNDAVTVGTNIVSQLAVCLNEPREGRRKETKIMEENTEERK